VAQQSNWVLGHLTVEVSISHTIRHTNMVGFLSKSYQLVAEDTTYTTQETNTHALREIQPAGFKPTIPAIEQPLDCNATGISYNTFSNTLFYPVLTLSTGTSSLLLCSPLPPPLAFMGTKNPLRTCFQTPSVSVLLFFTSGHCQKSKNLLLGASNYETAFN
jgi:hypothetical protein